MNFSNVLSRICYSLKKRPTLRWNGIFKSKQPTHNISTKNLEEYQPGPSGIPGIKFQMAKSQNMPVLVKLMQESFFKDEPIVKALGLSEKIDPEFIANQVKFASEGLTILAIDESNDEIIAAAMNNTVTPKYIIERPKEIEEIQCPHSQKIARFWYSLNLKPDIFALFGVPEFLEITYLVTTPAARGKRLAEKLSRESLSLGKHYEVPLIVMYCTNIASARIAQKLNMKLIGIICISNFFEGDDLLIFNKLPDDKVYVFGISRNSI